MISEPVWLVPEVQRRRYIIRVAVFAAALLAAAIATGTGAALVGEQLLPLGNGTVMTAVAASIAGFVLVRETRGRRLPIPQLRWQVPRAWMRRMWGGAVAFGAAMGSGVFTLQPSALFHLYLLGCALSGTATRGAAMGAIYGATYVAVVAFATARWRLGAPGYSPGYQSDILEHVAARVRWVGAIAAPLLLLVAAGP